MNPTIIDYKNIIKGDTYTGTTIQLVEDITGATILMQIKKTHQSQPLITLTETDGITVTSPTTGENLDTLDTGYLYNIQNNIYTTSRRPSNEWVVPPISSISRPIGFYGTNQHIPQAFLTAKGVTNTLTVHNELAPSGYTWLEEYLNQVDN